MTPYPLDEQDERERLAIAGIGEDEHDDWYDCDAQGVCIGHMEGHWCAHCPFYDADVEEWMLRGYG